MTCYSKLLNSTNARIPIFSAGRHCDTSSAQTSRNQSTPLCIRIGAATTAAAGLLLGRWNSAAYLTYIRCLHTVLSSVPHMLANADVTDQPSWDPNSC